MNNNTPSGVLWQKGITWPSPLGIIGAYQAWPEFQQTPPGTILVTAEFFALAPGAVVYDFMTDAEVKDLPLNIALHLGLTGASSVIAEKALAISQGESEAATAEIGADVQEEALTGGL